LIVLSFVTPIFVILALFQPVNQDRCIWRFNGILIIMTQGKPYMDPAELLQGRRFVSTRPVNRSAGLKEKFARYGAELLEMPMISIQPAVITADVNDILGNVGSIDWLIFTSENGVRHFMREIRRRDHASLSSETRVAVIGARTGSVAREYGINPSFTSTSSNAEGFSAELITVFSEKHPSVLWPTGSLSSDRLQKRLEGYCKLIRINLYRTEMPDSTNSNALRHVMEDNYDMIFFFSPSAVRNFLSLAGSESVDPSGVRAACIGPVTRQACIEAGIQPVFMAPKPDSEALFDSAIEYYHLKEPKNGIS
jgi:uroporphyrinogen-III synthase